MENVPGCVLIAVIAPPLLARAGRPAGTGLAVLAARLPLLPTVIVGVAAAGVLRHLLGYGTTNRDHESTMDAPQLITEDHWIDTAHGRVFARSWQDGDAAAAGLPPIVLMHDSLGCVRLWGTFPATLARHSGRRVIATTGPVSASPTHAPTGSAGLRTGRVHQSSAPARAARHRALRRDGAQRRRRHGDLLRGGGRR